MTLYYGATGRAFANVNIGQTGATSSHDVMDHVIEHDWAVMEDRANAMLESYLTTSPPMTSIVSLHLAGGSDGIMWCLAALMSADVVGGVYMPPDPQTSGAPGTRLFFYAAEGEHELQVQYQACRARIAAWCDVSPAAVAVYIDHQLAGAAQGNMQMGMIVVQRDEPI
jgi:hypothetical protein